MVGQFQQLTFGATCEEGLNSAAPQFVAPSLRVLIASLVGGGAERVCLRLLNEWVRTGKRVELLSMRGGGDYCEHLSNQVPVKVLGVSRARNSLPRLVRCLRKHPDVPVLVFAFELLVVLLLGKLIGLVRCPIIYRESNLPRKYIKPSWYWLYRLALSQCDGIIAQNAVEAAEIQGLKVQGVKSFVIPNPIHSQGTRPFLEVLRDDPLVLAAGRLEHQKGFDRLIRGFSLFAKRRPGSRLTILGTGTQMNNLCGLARTLGLENSVELPGFAPNISEYYARASVFVLSSHFEGMPNVLIEALVAGCRVIATDGGGGTGELMKSCGLNDFIVSQKYFVDELPDTIERAIATKPEVWEAARSALVRMCDASTIASAYWQACQASSLMLRRAKA